MGRAVATLDRKSFAGRELSIRLEEGIEGNEGTSLAFTEDSDAARELLAYGVGGFGISADRQADRSRSSCVWRAVDAATEARAKDARDERQLRTAADHVESCNVAAELADTGGIGDKQGFHGRDRRIDERGGVLVEVGDGYGRGFAVNGDRDELCGGGEGFLRGTCILDEAFPSRVA